MFKLLGALVALYAGYAVMRGEVFAKAGPWGRVVSRAESPRYFWGVIAVYAGLSVALVAVF
jgi:hypothetical protein